MVQAYSFGTTSRGKLISIIKFFFIANTRLLSASNIPGPGTYKPDKS